MYVHVFFNVTRIYYMFSVYTFQGVSFLEVKYQMLLSYLVNLSHLLSLKTHGKSIKGEGTVDRLVEIRTVSRIVIEWVINE